MRLDRTLTLSPLIRWLKIGNRPGIPILMYHSVCDAVEARHPYFETNISAATFERHLQFLQHREYATAHLSELHGLMQGPQNVRRFVVITFDDAFRNFYTQAFPLLNKYGFKATLFVPSGLVGRQSSILGPEPFMTWSEIREVCRHGVEVGSHTVSHPNLYHSASAVLQAEVKVSKADIENNIGEPVRSFAYPYAFPEHDKRFCQRFTKLLAQTGYENGVSTSIGTACVKDDRFRLPRLPINSYDDPALFAAKLNGHYDWLHTPQYLHKVLRAALTKPIRNPIQVWTSPAQP
jgi:peptidoglycan/xylan/chitin deacetylase (PgdA/CDA1 family)